ncbi:hypothetical protein B0H16DRAFT_1463023 [Mycena metata]|uniref:Uncharacterized protein n=1 Tax=Mycena metata TaxID=1033252 RepID=A0AAD7N449_9AGAR|nr:hypothetical protein B0H16DRAFT_1463023 [Mycena metata]
MPFLTRERTYQSLHSESSLGPKTSIHTLAKPLMKVMYHRAVLDLIQRQRGVPLTPGTMHIYESYLVREYVAKATKRSILGEIYDRALLEGEAPVVADFLVSYDALLDSTDVAIRNWTCWILAALSCHSSTRGAVIAIQPCARLITLLQ